jgi:hypothetical protein
MALSAREAFKVGFLARCVEDGLGPEGIAGRVKLALDLMEKQGKFLTDLVGHGVDLAKGVGSGMMSYGLPVALAAPPILGGAAGYGLAKATDIDDTDVADIKNREVIEEYRRQADKLRRMRAMRDSAQHDKRPGVRLFM